MNTIKSLQDIGLSEKEAMAYMALVELQEASVQEIAVFAKLNRPTAYIVLDSLIRKGLCSLARGGGKAKYYLESPENLLAYIRGKKQEVERQELLAREIAKELEAGASKRERTEADPFIRHFSGKRGLVAMRNDMFEEKNSTLRMLYSLDNYERAYDDLDKKEAHAMRTAKNIFAKVIYSSEKNKIGNDTTREARKVSSDKQISADIAIYNGKVRLSLFDGTSGVIISNKKIAETLAVIFDLAWSKLKQ